MENKTNKQAISMEKASEETVPGGDNSPKPGFWARLTEDAWANIIGGSLIAGVLIWVGTLGGAKPASPVYGWENVGELSAKVLNSGNLGIVAFAGFLFAVLSAFAVRLSGGNLAKYLAGFSFIFLMALLALIIGGNSLVNAYGIEYVVFALLIGLLLNNLLKLPNWIKDAARSEFFIKTGLVILGTSVLFTDIVKAGFPGILQALAVVSVVWFFSMWLSRRLKVDDEFGVMLASAVSICGVSAAIVASGAIQGDKKKLSYVTTLVLLMAIPMMILQPWVIQALGIPEVVGGAWLGGTLDTTASVAAASEQVGPAATKAGVIVKFSQNVLLGFAAFLIATWWVLKKNPDENAVQEKPAMKLIWERFPKFVLGFMAASLIFSFLIPGDTIKLASGFLNSLRTLWFALAFVAIGLEARFSDLLKAQGGRPALVFVGAQLFNIFWTLIWSYLLFGGILLSLPDIK